MNQASIQSRTTRLKLTALAVLLFPVMAAHAGEFDKLTAETITITGDSVIVGKLVQDADGFLYGITEQGEIKKFAPDGSEDTIYRVPYSGAELITTGLLLASDGRLYGAINYTAQDQSGPFMFRIDKNGGNYTPLASFAIQDVPNGNWGNCLRPNGPLMEGLETVDGTSGFIFGICDLPESENGGNTLFRTSLEPLSAAFGYQVEDYGGFGSGAMGIVGGLMQRPVEPYDTSSPIFFSALGQGDYGRGALMYAYDDVGNAGDINYSFDGVNTGEPASGLILVDGYFYGVTNSGGAHGFGTVYRVCQGNDPADCDIDGIPDAADNCPLVSNNDGAQSQANTGGDARGDACDVGATAEGYNISVAAINPGNGTPSPVQLTFASVATTGVSSAAVVIPGAGDPGPPSGFRLGTPAVYYQISTTATVSGPIELCIGYSGVSYTDESTLKLFHIVGGVAIELETSSLNTDTNLICATSPSLSPFFIAEQGAAVLPTVIVPSGVTAEATSAAGASVSFSASATDSTGRVIGVSCIPASGSVFQLGTVTVTCSASDAAGNTATAGFPVTVRDTTPPVVSLLSQTVMATGPTGTPVAYAATVADTVDTNPALSCTPASGTSFPVGITPVSCVAADASGNIGRASGTVTVAYGFSGYRPPINTDGSSIFNLGRTLPVKIRLVYANGTPVANAQAFLEVYRLSNGVLGSRVDIGASGPSNQFRYDGSDGQYSFELKMAAPEFSVWSFILRARLNDGSVHDVRVTLR